jgi:hypothetical protein
MYRNRHADHETLMSELDAAMTQFPLADGSRFRIITQEGCGF